LYVGLFFLVNCLFVLLNHTCVLICKIRLIDLGSRFLTHLSPLCMLHFCYSWDGDNVGFKLSIIQMEREIQELIKQRDLAQSQVEDLLRMVGNNQKSKEVISLLISKLI